MRSLCLLARALAIVLGIGGAGMRRVGTRRAAKVALDVAPTRRWWRIVQAIDWPKTLHRRPGLDQRAVDAEMLGRQKALHPRLCQQRREEPCGDRPFEQPVAVLREGGVIPHRLIDPAQVGAFAQALSKRAKADPIDAAVIAHFAKVTKPSFGKCRMK